MKAAPLPAATTILLTRRIKERASPQGDAAAWLRVSVSVLFLTYHPSERKMLLRFSSPQFEAALPEMDVVGVGDLLGAAMVERRDVATAVTH